MKSHVYDLSLRSIAVLFVPTLIVLLGSMGLLHTCARMGWLPAPSRAFDPGCAILAHQAYAARLSSSAKVVLLGDSSCMMDVDARSLSVALPGQPEVLNLGLISWLSFETYGELLADFREHNPGRPQTVVLLVAPLKLSLDRIEDQEGIWDEIRNFASNTRLAQAPLNTENWVGGRILRENLLSHVLPTPLPNPGEARASFGFSSEVDWFMTARCGSMIDFGTFTAPKRRMKLNWGTNPGLDTACREFRSKMPQGVRLIIGLTPSPESQVTAELLQRRQQMLKQWAASIEPDSVLSNLPATLPDVFFANLGHLNAAGQKQYTKLLARALGSELGPE